MGELTPSILNLDKGLDLVSAKVSSPIGSLLSCNNYEIADSEGLRRVDGFEPFDAQVPAGTTTLYYVRVDGSGSMPAVGDILVIEASVIAGSPSAAIRLITEDGDYIVTEDDEYIVQE